MSDWPPLAYQVSKAALNAGTRILARDNPDLLINCCCPGWVSTSLGTQAGQPPKSVGECKQNTCSPADTLLTMAIEEGAKIPLRLAVGDIGQVSGRYWADDSIADKGNGKVQGW